MDAQTLKAAIKNLTEIRARLEQATSIAKAAEAYAVCGNLKKGLKLALEIEPTVYAVSTFLNAASMINLRDSS